MAVVYRLADQGPYIKLSLRGVLPLVGQAIAEGLAEELIIGTVCTMVDECLRFAMMLAVMS